MAKFTTELDIDLLPDGEEDTLWKLKSPLCYFSDLIGAVEVPEYFQTDLASVPRIPIVYSVWGGKAHREGVLHDYLYRKDSKPLITFSMANRVMLEAMKSRGKPWYIRWPIYLGVCIGGYPCYHQRRVADKLT